MKNRSILRYVWVLGLAALVACSSGEERQAKYLERAQQLYDDGNYEKSTIEVKNALQINPRNSAGRYLLALLEEKEQKWRAVYSNLSLAVEEDPTLYPARLKLGQLLLLNKAYPSAREHADVILAAEPDNVDAIVLLASINLREGNTEAAVAEAQRALALEAGHVGATSVLASAYRENDPDKALAIIDEGLAVNSSSALKMLKLQLLGGQGETAQVIALLKELADEEPANQAYRSMLVQVLVQDGQIDEADAVTVAAVENQPDNVQVKLWRAQFLVNQKSPEEGAAALQGFIEQAPDSYELRFAMAKLHSAMNQPEAAKETLQAIIAIDSEATDSIRARNGLIELAVKEGQREEVERLLGEIFELEPENSEALRTRAKLYLVDKDIDSAIADLRTVLRNEPQSVETLLLVARASEAKGSRELALDNYLQVLAIDPKNRVALYDSARLQTANKQNADAEDSLRALLELDASNTKGRFLLVTSLVQQEKWQAALHEAAPLTENDDTRAQGLYLTGRVYFAQNENAKAIASMTAALKENPDIIEALEVLMAAYVRDEQTEEARAYLQQHLVEHPDHFHAHRLMGDFQRQQGDTEAALLSYQRALELMPTSAQLYQRIAAMYMAQDNGEQVVAILEQGSEQADQPLGLMVLLAGQYQQAGDYAKARETYEKVLAINPGVLMAANNLAIILVDHYQDEDSLRQAEETVETLRESEEPAFIDTMGWVNYKLGNYVRALTLLETAQALGGKGAEYDYHLGMAYHKNGQQEKAKEKLVLALADEADFAGKAEAEAVLGELQGS